jgi:hypothetical protein
MISLYELSVGSYELALDNSVAVMRKAQRHFEDAGQNPDDMIDFRFAPDMLPFTFQVISVRHHSLAAAQGLLSGKFQPPERTMDLNFAGMIDYLATARKQLDDISEADIASRQGKQIMFRGGKLELPFTAENFVLTFSLPNLYFHSTTLYDMLRHKGVPLGKLDYLGKMRT